MTRPSDTSAKASPADSSAAAVNSGPKKDGSHCSDSHSTNAAVTPTAKRKSWQPRVVLPEWLGIRAHRR